MTITQGNKGYKWELLILLGFGKSVNCLCLVVCSLHLLLSLHSKKTKYMKCSTFLKNHF